MQVVNCYDLSVLSMSVMGFQNESLDGGGWVDGVRSIQVFFLFFFIFNFAKPFIGHDFPSSSYYCMTT